MKGKRVLITGANGMLGQKLVDLFMNQPDHEVLFTSKGESRLNPAYTLNYTSLNIGSEEEVSHLVNQFNPDVVIHCAAMTHVDHCEDQKELCQQLNVDSVQHFIKAIGNKAIRFVHISTDFVFDGTKTEAYTEADQVNPISNYGMSKKRSEDLLLNSNLDYAILRTSFVYGTLYDHSRSNFVLWSKGSLEQNKEINVISDQFRAPTFAEDLAKASYNAAFSKVKGIYHVVGPETFSILGLINKVADFWNLDKSLITPILTKDLNQKAPRPLHTNLSIEKARKDLNYQPVTFEESLKHIDQQLKQ